MHFSLAIAVLVSSPLGAHSFNVSPKSVRVRSSLSMSSALIVQNKGGGHGELGYQIAKKLQSNPKISSITILQDDACNDEKEPFKSYSTDLPDVKVIKAAISSDESMSLTSESLQSILEGKSYEYIWDNASKKPEGCGKAICDLAKEWNTKLFTYVSSAGMYNPNADTKYPMDESSTPLKETAGQYLFDQYATSLNLPYVSFRPQYIYGKKANKFDYIDWFFDRLVKGLPLPIPGDGTQLVSLTNSEDVASLLTSVLNDEQAAIQTKFFNCGTDKLISYNDLAYLCAHIADIPREEIHIENYDYNLFGKANFPFRTTDFYVSPTLAQDKLKWSGAENTLQEDLKWYYKSYVEDRDGPNKKLDLAKDLEICAGSKK